MGIEFVERWMVGVCNVRWINMGNEVRRKIEFK